MLLPAGLRVLGAYGQVRSGDAAEVQGVADALVAAVPAQQAWHMRMKQVAARRDWHLRHVGMMSSEHT